MGNLNYYKKYSNVFIIGNGFDLNLGLKTSYKHFIDSTNFKDLLLIKNKLCLYLNNKYELQHWIDIENELKNYSKNIFNLEFRDEFDQLAMALKKYLRKIDCSKINKSALAYEVVKEINMHDCLFIDFNYTNSTEVVLSDLGLSDYQINDKVLKVHGSLKKDMIIVGVEDKADIKEEHNFLRKSANLHFNGDIDIADILNKAEQIRIFGHSLGETDHTYFEDFFRQRALPNNPENKYKIKFYYHGRSGLDGVQLQLYKLTSAGLADFRRLNDVQYINTEI